MCDLQVNSSRENAKEGAVGINNNNADSRARTLSYIERLSAYTLASAGITSGASNEEKRSI